MQNEVREFYNQYGIKEWNRLEESIYSRINYLLHMHFIETHLNKGMKILDAGCGAGRYSIEFAKKGCEVTLFDISDEQLEIAKGKIDELNLGSNIEGFFQGDIRDLSQFRDEQFDMIVCYGAPLSYVIDNRDKAITEFNRVLKKEGILALSVNSKWGVLKMLLGNMYPDFFNNPEYWYIDEVIRTGDLPKHEKVNHPPRHFFDAKEVEELLCTNGFNNITQGGSPCFCCGNSKAAEELGKEEKALKTIIQIELETYTKATMIDNGEFLLTKAIKDSI